MSRLTWIQDAVVLTQDRSRRALRGHVLIEHGKDGARIAKITTALPSPKQLLKSKARIIKTNGKVLIPGFVQAHVHLCQTLFRNQADDLELLDWLSKKIWPKEASHTPETLNTSAWLGIHDLLSSGTTTLLDMGTVRHTPSILEAALESGIRGSFGKCLMDHPETTPKTLRDGTEAALREAYDLFVAWNGRAGDRIRISYAPRFVISCTEGLLREVSRLSKAQRTLVHTHASENLKEIQIVKSLTHQENVEYLHGLGLTGPSLVLAHCVWLKPHEKEILARTGTHVAHCPSSNLKLASGIAHIPDLRARGINVALGADGAPCNNNLSALIEMRLAALIQKPGHGPRAMRAQEVFDMATLAGAQALGWQKDIGSIEVGKKADFALFDLATPHNFSGDFLEATSKSTRTGAIESDPYISALVYSTERHHLDWTMVDGKQVFSKGRLTAMSNEALMSRVTRAHALLARGRKSRSSQTQ